MSALPRLMLSPRAEPSTALALLSPVIAIGLTLLAGGLMLATMGYDPAEALSVYFLSPFADSYSRAELLVKAGPLALIGAGLAVCFRANVWNIGAAGQYTAGAIAAGAVGLYAPEGATGPHWMVLYLAAGMLGGMVWGAIPAALRTKFNANEILVSLMLAYVAGLLLDFLVRGPWRDPMSFGFPQAPTFGDAFRMPILVAGTRLHAGLLIAPVAGIALAWMMARTLRGFELRVQGAAPRAASFAGFPPARAVWFALLLSGGLAGLAGAIEVAATLRKLQPDIAAGYGFTAIIVAFLGRLNPAGALLGALVLAVSYIGGENAQILLKLPKNVTGIFQGMLLFFLLICDTLIRYRIHIGRRAGA